MVPLVVQLREIKLNSDQNCNWQPEDKWRARDRQLLEKAWHPRVESEQCAKETECRWGWRLPGHGKRGVLWTRSLSGELKGEAAGMRLVRCRCLSGREIPSSVARAWLCVTATLWPFLHLLPRWTAVAWRRCSSTDSYAEGPYAYMLFALS